MWFTRALRKAVSRLLIGSLLFAQLAIAAYACPALPSTEAVSTMTGASERAASTVPAPMAGCEEIDPGASPLCTGHCQQGQQSVDTTPVPGPHTAIATFLYSLAVGPVQLLPVARSRSVADVGLAVAPSPPHAILHCVFRT